MPLTPPASQTSARHPVLLAVWLAALLLQAGHWLNPGYFSHDELQWAVRADVASLAALPWVGWTDLAAFQWRPLTFNTWMPLSYALFDTPRLWHLLWAMAGAALGAGLAALVWRLGARPLVAAAAGLVFVANPYATYVHGWVATLADLLWVACALGLAHALLTLHRRGRAGLPVALLAFVLTAVALTAKEAAVAIPPLLAAAWLLGGRSRTLAWAAAGSGLAACIYLGLRLGVLLSPTDGAYAVSLAHLPRNLMAFALFPLRPSAFEVQSFLPVGVAQLLVSGTLLVSVLLAMRRHAPRLAALLLVGAPLALAPALPLEVIANQYAYGASAWVVACVALAFGSLGTGGRVGVLLMALVTSWHGYNVQRTMHEVGQRQSVFQPALAALLPLSREPLKLHVPARDAWMYARLTHEVPSWRGVAIGDRVQWVDASQADFRVLPDGSLAPQDRDP